MQHRPDPEALLKRAQEEELQSTRGKLKIYLGAAPGVGKTYTMLQDALDKQQKGLNVLVGVVETHGRTEVETLLNEFEILPRQSVSYHQQALMEFDLDSARKCNPGLILMDEMAHTNAPGLRHAKRWQDIKELLDRGINVYTTLNIQHVESLNDVVSQIIHTRIKETVPDFMLELADTIELVDLPPEDLLKRLQEGKVYFPKQAELAAQNFFRKGNLIALRELALRTTAERVGTQVLVYRQGQGIKHVWPVKEKILVCVGTHSKSMRLIRAARRLAKKLQAQWIAVHIDTPQMQLTASQRNEGIQNLRLAERLGAQTRVVTGYDIANEILNLARLENITQIVVGKPVRSRWKELLYGSLADELIRKSGEIDVYIITGEPDFPKNVKTPKVPASKTDIAWTYYARAFAIVCTVTFFQFLFSKNLNASNVVMLYMSAIAIISLFGRIGATVFATFLSILLYGYFTQPLSTEIDFAQLKYLFTGVMMLGIGAVITRLIMLTRRQSVTSHLAEQRTATLNVLSRQLASTRGVNKLLNSSVEYVGDIFESSVIALLPEEGALKIKARYRASETLSEKDLGVAAWVLDIGQIAGLGTDTLPYSDAIYVPLLTSQGAIGVLRVKPAEPEHLFIPEQMRLLEACANQIALAIEVDRYQELAHASHLESETDRARNALLQSVSHDLRTPLVAILGAASTLIEMSSQLEPEKIKKLGAGIYFESEELSRLIQNMLQISYLEADAIKLRKDEHSLKEILDHALLALRNKLRKKPLNINVPADLPLVPVDSTLLQEVFYNLIDNSIKFTPPDSAIDITVIKEVNKLIVSVKDRGPGIVPDEVNKLFDKFYRGRMLSTERGLGLGLAICRSVIKVHGGEIWAEDREGGGAAFYFSLPLEKISSTN